jgi:hypothetical protein
LSFADLLIFPLVYRIRSAYVHLEGSNPLLTNTKLLQWADKMESLKIFKRAAGDNKYKYTHYIDYMKVLLGNKMRKKVVKNAGLSICI